MSYDAWGVAPFLTDAEAQEADVLYDETEAAIAGASADMGEEAIEAGGWVDVVRSIISMSEAPDVVKLDVLRRHGLEARLETPRVLSRNEADELMAYLDECRDSAGQPWR